MNNSLSTAVRNGMISPESSLDLIETLRQVWKILMERLQRESRQKGTQAPSLSMVAAASTVTEKRMAGSPPEHPREEKEAGGACQAQSWQVIRRDSWCNEGWSYSQRVGNRGTPHKKDCHWGSTTGTRKMRRQKEPPVGDTEGDE
ncbi:hypothetical protein J6590_013100 [Homalodisca vitripennis]|nr:hypothetical protein J6590_090802 [Homalodisca vitripennis]KAG8317965.1 hypothetical protein J6590_013100 [Homalodisca vitripennis]